MLIELFDEPGLDTDLMLTAMVFGIVTPTKDLESVAVPPLPNTLLNT